MKFVPGLGAVISTIDAIREFMKGNISGGILEGLSALFSIIPIPGASIAGKGITKALGWGLKYVPGFKRLAAAGGQVVPGIFKRFAPGLYDKLDTLFKNKNMDIISRLIPESVRRRIGNINARSMSGLGPGAAGPVHVSALQKAQRTATTQSIVSNTIGDAALATGGLGAVGAVVGAGQALYQGPTPTDQVSVQSKIAKLITPISEARYPKNLTVDTIDGDSSQSPLTLKEAQKQEALIGPWLKGLEKTDSLKRVTEAGDFEIMINNKIKTLHVN
jgi:hypothetical protein